MGSNSSAGGGPADRQQILYRDAGELFDDLDHYDNKLQAADRMIESFERKTHAQARNSEKSVT